MWFHFRISYVSTMGKKTVHVNIATISRLQEFWEVGGISAETVILYLFIPRSVRDPSSSMPDSWPKEGNHLGRGPIPGERHGCAWVTSILNRFINIILVLFRDETNTRDYLYNLAFGNTRRKEYVTALEYICALLLVDPGNIQAQVRSFRENLTISYIWWQELEVIAIRLLKNGMVKMAVAGGAALAFGWARQCLAGRWLSDSAGIVIFVWNLLN